MGQHGAHLGATGPRWAPCWPHELCYLGLYYYEHMEDEEYWGRKAITNTFTVFQLTMWTSCEILIKLGHYHLCASDANASNCNGWKWKACVRREFSPFSWNIKHILTMLIKSCGFLLWQIPRNLFHDNGLCHQATNHYHKHANYVLWPNMTSGLMG